HLRTINVPIAMMIGETTVVLCYQRGPQTLMISVVRQQLLPVPLHFPLGQRIRLGRAVVLVLPAPVTTHGAGHVLVARLVVILGFGQVLTRHDTGAVRSIAALSRATTRGV